MDKAWTAHGEEVVMEEVRVWVDWSAYSPAVVTARCVQGEGDGEAQTAPLTSSSLERERWDRSEY